MIQLAGAVEEAGWDGLFLWDHLLRPESNEILDTWVTLSSVATVTERIRIGPLVTPLARRRPMKLAREVLTVDLLSQGRITLGLGLGVDSGGELSRLGEVTDAKTRGAMLDQGADIVARLLEGELVVDVGDHYTVDGVMLEPRTVQQPRPPLWFAARADALKPVRRAARFEGLFPIEMDSDQFRRALDEIVAIRGSLDGFDVCVKAEIDGSSPAFAGREATWLLQSWPAVADLDQLFDVVTRGPAR